MIIGDYPCCDGPLIITVPDAGEVTLPAYLPEDCPHCGERVWHIISRVNPVSYTEAEFLKLYEINEKTKQIKDKNKQPPPAPPPQKPFKKG